ncbi:MAG: hypothetical protein QXU42_06445 [Thermoproteota archaeon]
MGTGIPVTRVASCQKNLWDFDEKYGFQPSTSNFIFHKTMDSILASERC